ncbi:AAA family ATPase [Allobranchiibius sp. GilTou73]|uniref:AAA family ATPase n=1 Tax=Allobranchiibius sp. GilTou73 TaxID=2904523 RepID=UPI001F359DA2|nr:SMC family ATPase [Allobranchiibius sp. GilTou73]UIJ34034.1 SMC family ATPase [Allobranchiibius sp. GilTou73]
MRLHLLELQAFGPFAGLERVDFDALDAAGLYLIHGATGAGKTSILDAVSYAVYGALPGGRTGHRETIRSDHADPSVPSHVQIEFTAAGERLRIRRSPEWDAPKKRGTGTTRRPATVLLEVLHGSEWVAQSTRMDEAAEIVTDHLGLGLEQFAQVVLLPQGEFATFLRAKPEDRGALLGRLFDIERFTAAQDWLAERRRELNTQVRETATALAHQADRLVDLLAELDLPAPHDQPQTADAPEVTALHATVVDCRRLAADHATRALVDADDADRQRDIARDALQQADRLVGLQQQARAARAVLQAYAAREDERCAQREAVRASRRAAVVRPVAARRREAVATLDAASSRLEASVAQARALVGPTHSLDSARDRSALACAIADGGRALTGLRDLESQAAAEARSVGHQGDEASATAEQLAAVVAHLDQLRDRVERIEAELAGAADPGPDAVSAAERVVESIRTAQSAHESLERSLNVVGAAREHTAKVTPIYVAAEEQVLELRRRRLAGMVGEIGGELRPGCPCPVCGSEQHPAPAMPVDDAVTAADVERAEADAEAARTIHADAQTALAIAQGRHEDCVTAHRLALAAIPGWAAEEAAPDADALRELLSVARRAVAAAISVRDHRQTLTKLLAESAAATSEAQEAHARAQAGHAAAVSRLAETRERLSDIERRMADRRGRHAQECWCDLVDQGDPLKRHQELERAGETLQAADQTWRAAQDDDRKAAGDLSEILTAQDFPDLPHAVEALLTADRVEHLEQTVATERAAYDRAVGVLDQPNVADAETAPAPDLPALEEAAQSAEHRRTTTAQAVSTADRAVRDLDSIAAAVRELAQRSRPALEELAVLGPLADTAAGHGDNLLRMRLTSYVLAARLELVTALANDHLKVMSDGRFTLEHSDELARGGARSGLGLRVLDAWTGRARDTASLSGGEAFTASLALALGLGDAVLHDSGGRPLGTLFVDEGFGSLDEETLDQVMEVLDGLRAGGRSVGIVSHVGELRARIRSRVQVRKTESGSHIEVIPAAQDAVA